MIITELGWALISIIVIGISMIVAIELNKKPAGQKEENTHACFKCGQTDDLLRIAFVDDDNNAIGYLIACKNCIKEIDDKKIQIYLKNTKGDEAIIISE